MRVGPRKIKECDSCGQLILQHTILSGNTFNAVYWSDGKVEAPMLPDFPLLVKCPRCNGLLWIDDLVTIEDKDIIHALECKEMTDFFSGLAGNSEAHSSKYDDCDLPVAYNYPNLKDYILYVKSKTQTVDREIYIRIRAWWSGNDARRNCDLVESMAEEEIINIVSLKSLLNINNTHEKIMKAEIYRELGQFDRALDLLDITYEQKWANWVWIIKKLCSQRISSVEKVKSPIC